MKTLFLTALFFPLLSGAQSPSELRHQAFQGNDIQRICDLTVVPAGKPGVYFLNYPSIQSDNHRLYFAQRNSENLNQSLFYSLSIDGHQEMQMIIPGVVVDFLVDGDNLYLIKKDSSLEKWSLAKREKQTSYPTTERSIDNLKKRPTGLVLFENQLFISHGMLGVTVLDLASGKITAEIPLAQGQPYDLQSQAADIASNGSMAYITMESANYDPQGRGIPFNGFITVDMKSRNVMKQTPINTTQEVFGFPKIEISNDTAIVQNSGILLTYPLAMLDSEKIAYPTKRIWAQDRNGVPLGRVWADETAIYSCMKENIVDQTGGRTKVTMHGLPYVFPLN